MLRVPRGQLYLGGSGAGDTLQTLMLERHRLTTHGAIIGMTGSGKTGLGIVLLEETLLGDVPVLVIDPKGDMGNLLLQFPELRGEDFRPWIDEGAATREGISPDAHAERVAESWRSGLERWWMQPGRIRALANSADITLYTPGSHAGAPLNVLGAPTTKSGSVSVEDARDEIEAFASSLLRLAGIDADPLSSPEHVLIATLLERAHHERQSLDLPTLLLQIQTPPLRKVGVFDVDQFFPPKQRTALAMKLNTVLASPSFATWLEGAPLDIQSMLYTPKGKPRAAIVYLAHLSEEERQLVVTLLLSRLVSWMRTQPGTSDLRVLTYMDEVFGYCPPTAMPPSKKPILTLLKQGRAFGIGLVLATQNPVDLDYKAMSNMGTWLIGRLQTERDKERVLEGLRGAGGANPNQLADIITGLQKRQYLLHRVGEAPTTFSTRWAMSYLRGPLTRAEVERLSRDAKTAPPAPTSSQPHPAPPPLASAPANPPKTKLADDEALAPPATAPGVLVQYADRAATWLAAIGAHPAGAKLAAAIALRVSLRFDERKADLDHLQHYEGVVFPLGPSFDAATVRWVDHDPRDFRPNPPSSAIYRIPSADLSKASFFKEVTKAIATNMHRHAIVEISQCPELKLYSRVGESRTDFAARCRAAADSAADAELAKLKDRYAARIEKTRDQLVAAQQRHEELRVDTQSRKQQEWVAGAGQLLSAFVGGRSSARGLASAASRRSTTRRTQQRLKTAEAKIESQAERLEDLEDELADVIEEVTQRWQAAAEKTEVFRVGLEKDDIDITDVSVVWVPVE